MQEEYIITKRCARRYTPSLTMRFVQFIISGKQENIRERPVATHQH